MKNDEIQKMLLEEYNYSELQKLAKKQEATVSEMAHGDKIILEDSLLDYLRDFFNEIFDGQPILKTFEKVLIEWHTQQNLLINLYVTFPTEKEHWVYIDIFVGWRYVGKVLYPNVELNDEDRIENGQYYTYTPILSPDNNFDEEFLMQIGIACKDVFMYVFMYIEANKNTPSFCKVKKLKWPNKKANGKKQNKGTTKKPNPADVRNKVYVPSTRRIYQLEQPTEENKERLCEYVYSRWKVRGYTYTRRDGKVVNVKEHLAHRHFPNKGVKKDEVTGTDYILRKSPEEDS